MAHQHNGPPQRLQEHPPPPPPNSPSPGRQPWQIPFCCKTHTCTQTHTHTHVHRQKQADTLMFVSAWLSASYCTFGRKTLLCICETGSQYEELEFHKQMLHFFPSLFLLGCCVLREKEVKEHAGLRYIYPVQKWKNVTVKRWKSASETAFSCLAFFPHSLTSRPQSFRNSGLQYLIMLAPLTFYEGVKQH